MNQFAAYRSIVSVGLGNQLGRACVAGAAAALAGLLWYPAPAAATHCADVQCGDLDGNGVLSPTDALRLLRRVVGVDLELVCPIQCVAETTTTTTSTTTTTTPVAAEVCTVIFRLDEFVDLVGLSIDVDYSDVVGELLGDGEAADCRGLDTGGSTTFFADDGGEKILSADVNGLASAMNGPIDFLSCRFRGSRPSVSDFAIEVRDAIRSLTAMGSGGSGVCGAPVTGLARPTVRDVMAIQRASLGAPVSCPLCECDANGSGLISFGDSLQVQRASLRIPQELSCPACGYPVEVRGVGDPVSVVVSGIGCQPVSTTTTTTTTSTTLPDVPTCSVVFRLDEFVDVLGVSFAVDYSAFPGELLGEGVGAACTVLGGGPLLNDEDAAKRLSVNLTSGEGGFNALSGPVDILSCDFSGEVALVSDFAIDVIDVVRDFSELRAGGSGVCASPATGLSRPTVRDSLLIVAGSVAGAACPLCECDVDGSGVVAAADWLATERASIGLNVQRNCPACPYPPELGPLGDPVSIVVSNIGCF